MHCIFFKNPLNISNIQMRTFHFTDQAFSLFLTQIWTLKLTFLFPFSSNNFIFNFQQKKRNHFVSFFYSLLCLCSHKKNRTYIVMLIRAQKRKGKKTKWFHLLVVKIWEIPTRISPSPLMWLCKIAFSRMSPNICDCIKWVVKCQMRCMIAGSSIRSWQQRTLDAVDFVPSSTVTVMCVCVCVQDERRKQIMSHIRYLTYWFFRSFLFDALVALRCKKQPKFVEDFSIKKVKTTQKRESFFAIHVLFMD